MAASQNKQSTKSVCNLSILALFAVAAWNFASSAFCNAPVAERRTTAPLTQREGWRFDKMEFGLGGIGQLVVHEGYYIGEKAMFEILNKQGRRYRMRPTKDELEKGVDVDQITQIGPIKMRLNEAFGGSSTVPGLVRPDGYSGAAGVAAWDRELPIKGGFVEEKR